VPDDLDRRAAENRNAGVTENRRRPVLALQGCIRGEVQTLDEAALNEWFCREVLPLERSLTRFIQRNWRVGADVTDLRQDIYERALVGARSAIPINTRQYVFTVARNHLINRAMRAKVVPFELVADMASLNHGFDLGATERQLNARDELRRVQEGLDRLPPRCREVVRLRKVEGLSTRETADVLEISVDTVEKQMTQGMRALVDFILGGTGKIKRPPVLRRRSRGDAQ
jgi:RNA polymerase sigma factor (sigma-70 family)